MGVVGAHWIGTVEWAQALVVWFQHGLQIFYKDSGRTARWCKLEAGVNVCEGERGGKEKPGDAVCRS